MEKNARFEVVYAQGLVNRIEIMVDKETGVNYLFRLDGYGGGITPLYDKDGKIVVTNVNE